MRDPWREERSLFAGRRDRPVPSAAPAARRPRPLPAPPPGPDGAHRTVSRGQAVGLALVGLGGAVILALRPHLAGLLVSALFTAGFLAASLLKLVSALVPAARPGPVGGEDAVLPAYTLIVPLYREAAVVGELVEALGLVDYPRDRLQALIVLEEDDAETRAALLALDLASFIQVLTAEPGAPRTKPRACNLALERARGELVVVYDAEDRPHPQQLREAAARFAAGDARLACLQAPLRIEIDGRFLPAQFALEYAVQFEVLLPALARWGLPFPLGGTSNHFRVAALRAVGGWDPYNVTEDADIGFRLAARGYRLDVIGLPTYEPAPTRLSDWLPQRARWVKGHMQTLAVHARGATAGSPRGLAALLLTLMLSVMSSHAHGVIALWGVAATAELMLHGAPLGPPAGDLALMATGWTATALAGLVGLRRAGAPVRLRDFLGAAVYWPLQSVAAARASLQLVREPHRWDKTRHAPRTGRPAA
ncbi:MAG: CESA-like glycosyltransferase [Caulobacter sp.]|nr:CESA-like glycosyltransferase [Caulobacter sp.]